MTQVESDLNGLVKKNEWSNDFIDLLLELKQKGVIIRMSIDKVNLVGTSKEVQLEFDDILLVA